MKFLQLFFLFFLFVFISCNRLINTSQSKKSKPQNEVNARNESKSPTKIERKKKYPDPAKFNLFLSQSIGDTGQLNALTPIIIGKSILQVDSFVCSIYRANQFNCFWGDSTKCRTVISLLRDARYDGLSPSIYETESLERKFAEVFKDKRKRNDTLYWNLELSLTNQYVRYLNHLRFGKTDPHEIFKDWNYKRDYSMHYSAVQFSELINRNFKSMPDKFRPTIKLYSLLRTMLISLDSAERKSDEEWDKIPYTDRDLSLGDTSWVIIKIKNRLLSIGLIQEDSLTNLFDDELLGAINYFQEHVGLKSTGKIDKVTTYKLNFTFQEIKDIICVNMERCRWFQTAESFDYYIVVNIADYHLRVYSNDKEIYKTKVVVGNPGHETPLFNSKLTTIEFNPTWTVPHSIATEEFLSKLKTNPDFLNRNNMDIYQGDSIVQLLDFSVYSKEYFPFKIIQRAGNDNSLGLVKFLFPNSYSVYLHDTPSKSLFDKDVRAFSHGCIRVYKPLELAHFFLSEQGFTRKKIDIILETKKTTAIRLEKNIPIVITYWTCVEDEKNGIVFYKDIYGRDKRILKALNF